MNRKIAMLQPNYIPWKGVFDLINLVDVFVFYDDVQYTTKDWRNRNKIKTHTGEEWLTVPVKSKGLRNQLICDAVIESTSNWQLKHYKSIYNNYKNAPFFETYAYILEELYLKKKWSHISELNIFSTKLIAEALDIQVIWYKSSELCLTGNKNGEKIVNICNHLDCNYFINGPAAKAYSSTQLFIENNITLDYIVYKYPEYKQQYDPFSHHVSVLDVLFNCGPKAKNMICLGQTELMNL